MWPQKLPLGALSVAMSLVIGGCGTNDEAKVPQTEETGANDGAQIREAAMTDPGDPPVRLIEPKWRPLTGSEIQAVLSGQRLSIDQGYEVAPGLKPQVYYVGGCHPDETFYADGRWASYFCFRGPTHFSGRWTTEPFRGGEHLCVEAPDFPKRCRFVWQGRMPNLIFMQASVSMGRGQGIPSELEERLEFFNPYLLTPIE